MASLLGNLTSYVDFDKQSLLEYHNKVLTKLFGGDRTLGIQGTFLGDYFGFLKEEIVTGFPFNVTGAPMYWGSTMSFLGTALLFAKPAGLLLTAEVYLVYTIALWFEDPFTAGIYAKRDRDRAAAKAGKKSN
ncbi:hypothetical protein LLEC1_07669 [Akanthomyces lecanii]|uniref:phosphatidyl-N-methylethanolamine N-methyltransferase n=1 Tax=Cordyceps confragosa TaxID=2714763 RepID=A0A179IA98_CORDF|nr:hypothetical protein LLEC1_07669 [Akanthomyces lecanii]